MLSFYFLTYKILLISFFCVVTAFLKISHYNYNILRRLKFVIDNNYDYILELLALFISYMLRVLFNFMFAFKFLIFVKVYLDKQSIFDVLHFY